MKWYVSSFVERRLLGSAKNINLSIGGHPVQCLGIALYKRATGLGLIALGFNDRGAGAETFNSDDRADTSLSRFAG